MEAEVGILLCEAKDRIQGAALRAWLEDEILAMFGRRILVVDARVARQAARLHVPNPSPKMDALIGATALVNGCVLVTRNTRDFENHGVELINPWEWSVESNLLT